MVTSAPKRFSPRRRKWTLAAFFAAATAVAIIVALAVSLTLPARHDAQSQKAAPPSGARDRWPAPEALNGTIPNNAVPQTMDPSLVRRGSDNKLFLFTTGGPNGTVWTSDSLYGPWEKSPQPMLNERAGAPQVYYLNGTYYMFYNSHLFKYASVGITEAAATMPFHDASIKVQSSDTLEPGTWQDHGRLNITWSPDYNILDASLLTVENTTAGTRQNLLAFGSYQTGLFQMPLTDPPVELAVDAMNDMTHLEENTTFLHIGTRDRTEATFQYYRDPWYYLFFSSGRCCPDMQGSWAAAIEDPYRIMVCRSSDPRGGFLDQQGRDCATQNGGTEVLPSHGEVFVPGGQGIMDDAEVGTVLYYHYVPLDVTTGTIEVGFRFGWNRLDFDDSGWPNVVSD